MGISYPTKVTFVGHSSQLTAPTYSLLSLTLSTLFIFFTLGFSIITEPPSHDKLARHQVRPLPLLIVAAIDKIGAKKPRLSYLPGRGLINHRRRL
jgi:hypothetical protein